MNYVCPFQKRVKQLKPLVCKILCERQSIAENASPLEYAKCYCAYQHYCPSTRQSENTENAKKCLLISERQ